MAKNIPIQKKHERSEFWLEVRHHLNGIDEKGFESRHYLDYHDEEGPGEFYAHRNDSYFFIVSERGHASMVVDFDVVEFIGGDIYFVAPGQVQDDVRANECDYWYIDVATPLIPKEYLEVFENAAPFQKPQNMSGEEFRQCRSVVQLLWEQFAGDPGGVYYRQLTQELLKTFLCIVARQYVRNDITGSASRPAKITRDLMSLLKENIKSEKRPSRYAGMLNISEAYLNETVKKITGFTAGYWIRHYVVLEAKRLLSYTEMTVKEIAHTLGYEDHTYFSRLFRQATGTTPLTFRTQYMK